MAKKAKKLLKKIAKYGAIYVCGVVTAAGGYMLLSTPPNYTGYTGYAYAVDVGAEKISGQDLAAQFAKASAYLYDPVYWLERQKGVDILEALARRGVVSAMLALSDYYALKVDAYLWWPAYASELITASHQWAHEAAVKGNPSALIQYLNIFSNLAGASDEDIRLLETYADSHRGAAKALVNYYTTPIERAALERDAAKAAYWQERLKNLPIAANEAPVLEQKDYLHK